MKETVHIIQPPPVWLKPPLSLAFLQSYLKKEKIKSKIIDLNQIIFKALSLNQKRWLTLNKKWEKSLFAIVEKQYPHILKNICREVEKSNFIGFSIFERNLDFSFSLAKKIKRLYPKKKIIFGGPSTFLLEKNEALNQEEYWVIGEGEKALAEILNGSSQKIHRFTQIKDLDSLPFYNFDSLYLPGNLKQLPLFSSRGCKFNCNFCGERFLYEKFRCHSPEYILGLISYLKEKYNTNNFIFSDSFLNHSHRWLEKFCRLLIKNKMDIKWEAQFRASKNLPLSLAKLIKKSGCYNIFIGLESGSDKVLKLMNKKLTASDALAFFRILNKAGIHFEISLILGYPGEGKKDFADTVNFILKNKKVIPKIAQVNPFIDYMKNFRQNERSKETALKRVSSLIEVIQGEKIPYTKAFINNLSYQGVS